MSSANLALSRWTSIDDHIIRDGVRSGHSDEEIARALGRTLSATRQRRIKLGLFREPAVSTCDLRQRAAEQGREPTAFSPRRTEEMATIRDAGDLEGLARQRLSEIEAEIAGFEDRRKALMSEREKCRRVIAVFGGKLS